MGRKAHQLRRCINQSLKLSFKICRVIEDAKPGVANPCVSSLHIDCSRLLRRFSPNFVVFQGVKLFSSLCRCDKMEDSIVPPLPKDAHILDIPPLEHFVPLLGVHVCSAVHKTTITEDHAWLASSTENFLESILQTLLQLHHGILHNHRHPFGAKIRHLKAVGPKYAERFGTGNDLESTLTEIRRQTCQRGGFSSTRAARKDDLVEWRRTESYVPEGLGGRRGQLGGCLTLDGSLVIVAVV
mmetsp:Transcript_26662/g.62429  ORF Transcript_26662/g.62429 Transcript_26662/m.62429 type:complete len:241 (+) Transcript_26662:226-948(+)